MIFYLTIFVGLILLRFSLGEYSPSNRRVYLVVLCLLFTLAAFRFEVGCDWDGYYLHYTDQKEGTFETALQKPEWLWYMFLEVIDQIGLSYLWVNIGTSAVFFLGVNALSKRQPDPLGFLILLFPILIINLPMSGIRQGAAVGLICMAMVAFLDRRLIAMVIFTLIAASIHSSAILFLLLIPFCLNLQPSMQWLLAGLLALPGLYFMYTGQAADVAFTRYVATGRESVGALYRVALVAGTGLFFVAVLRRSWAQLFPSDYRLVTISAMLMLAFGGLYYLSPIIADRFGYYLIPIQAVILTRLPYCPMRSGRLLFFLAPYLLLLAVFIAWVRLSSLFEVCYVPYRLWFFPG